MYKVDQVKLAEILNVSKMAISKSISNGRLSKSIRKTTANKYEIELVTAIFEWFENADLSKDRGHHQRSQDIDDILELQESRKIKEHYTANLERLNFEERTGKLLDRAQTEKEVFEAFRLVRDQIQALPDKLCGALASKEDVQDIRKYLTSEFEKTIDEVATAVNSVLH